MSKNDELRYGPLGETAVHICVDMQKMFAENTDWKMPWLARVLPNIVSITSAHPEKTIFTRFIPARKPGQGVGMWRLLRALGIHDHRPARPRNDRTGPRRVRPPPALLTSTSIRLGREAICTNTNSFEAPESTRSSSPAATRVYAC